MINRRSPTREPRADASVLLPFLGGEALELFFVLTRLLGSRLAVKARLPCVEALDGNGRTTGACLLRLAD
jgi:hypothetical protein